MATTSNSSPRRSRDISNFARKYLLFLIPIMTVVVIGTVACIFIFNPEQQVKSKLSSLAQHYYEDYFYTNLENSDQFSGDAEKARALGLWYCSRRAK